MDDSAFGTRNKRGDWAPHKPVQYAPVFIWPAQPLRLLKWLFGYPGYFLPWNVLFAGITIVLWLFLTPEMSRMKTLSVDWIIFLYVRNSVLTAVWFGGFHLHLYVQRKQDRSFKYNSQWPVGKNDTFLFNNQTIDNVIWTFASGVVIWTLFEVATLHMAANGVIPYVNFSQHPAYCIGFWILIPLYRELHFYLIHRLIHWPPLYKAVHKLHHNNVNPTPWTGLAMHPVEHVLYFSGVALYWIVPSHPIHAVFHLAHCMLASGPGHVGYDKVIVGESAIDMPGYAHYLHHKYFECNYADGVVPYDKWFGTFHDGSRNSEARMNERFMRQAAKQQTSSHRARP